MQYILSDCSHVIGSVRFTVCQSEEVKWFWASHWSGPAGKIVLARLSQKTQGKNYVNGD